MFYITDYSNIFVLRVDYDSNISVNIPKEYLSYIFGWSFNCEKDRLFYCKDHNFYTYITFFTFMYIEHHLVDFKLVLMALVVLILYLKSVSSHISINR
jgi:hypothetical protein